MGETNDIDNLFGNTRQYTQSDGVGRFVTFSKRNIFKSGPKEKYAFPYEDGKRYAAPLLRNPWDHEMILPEAQQLIDLLERGNATIDLVSGGASDSNPYQLEDDLAEQGQATYLKGIINHKDEDGNSMDFDGYGIAHEPSHESPVYLLEPNRFKLKSEIDNS